MEPIESSNRSDTQSNEMPSPAQMVHDANVDCFELPDDMLDNIVGGYEHEIQGGMDAFLARLNTALHAL